jgi:MFS family permease
MFLNRNRSGSYVIMLSLAAAMFGMFFFIVLFVQNVLSYSPIESGFAFLPVSVAIFISAGLSTKLLPKFGPKPFLLIGALLTGSGMAWLTLIDTQTTYLGGILLPMLLFGLGMGFCFVTLTLTAVSGVPAEDSGAASGLLNATQQVGGSLGLSILVTVFGTASRNEADKQIPDFLAHATPEQQALFAKLKELPPPWGHEVLSTGISTAFIAAVAFVALAGLVTVFVIRVKASDMASLRGTGEESAAPTVVH